MAFDSVRILVLFIFWREKAEVFLKNKKFFLREKQRLENWFTYISKKRQRKRVTACDLPDIKGFEKT